MLPPPAPAPAQPKELVMLLASSGLAVEFAHSKKRHPPHPPPSRPHGMLMGFEVMATVKW